MNLKEPSSVDVLVPDKAMQGSIVFNIPTLSAEEGTAKALQFETSLYGGLLQPSFTLCGIEAGGPAMLETLFVKNPAAKDASCIPGQYSPEASAGCRPCEENHFCLGGDHYKVACPSGTGPKGSADSSYCQCKEGFGGSKGRCILCNADVCEDAFYTAGCELTV
jgi:hypothetical protein